ncbi:MAG TPA: hypothetical protein VME86_05700 [Acidobacteriaceae bacterium]|nr:hypothetical protein [Acidobacteriaceae bacterium]
MLSSSRDFGSMPDVSVIYACFIATSTATFEIVVRMTSVGPKVLLTSAVHDYLTAWEAAAQHEPGLANDPSEVPLVVYRVEGYR